MRTQNVNNIQTQIFLLCNFTWKCLIMRLICNRGPTD